MIFGRFLKEIRRTYRTYAFKFGRHAGDRTSSSPIPLPQTRRTDFKYTPPDRPILGNVRKCFQPEDRPLAYTIVTSGSLSSFP